jgi:hypothetical protein
LHDLAINAARPATVHQPPEGRITDKTSAHEDAHMRLVLQFLRKVLTGIRCFDISQKNKIRAMVAACLTVLLVKPSPTIVSSVPVASCVRDICRNVPSSGSSIAITTMFFDRTLLAGKGSPSHGAPLFFQRRPPTRTHQFPLAMGIRGFNFTVHSGKLELP